MEKDKKLYSTRIQVFSISVRHFINETLLYLCYIAHGVLKAKVVFDDNK